MAPPARGRVDGGLSPTRCRRRRQGATVRARVQALDWCNQVGTATATVNIDTTKPGTETLGNVEREEGQHGQAPVPRQ